MVNFSVMSHPGNQRALELGVIQAAEAALAKQQYVSAIDVFCGTGRLQASQVDSWRKGRTDFLERVIQGNLKKISASMAIFRHWAIQKGLKPSEAAYQRKTRGTPLPLRFSKSGNPEIEKSYRTHYLSLALSKRKSRPSQHKLDQPPQLVVYEILRTAQCSECGVELEQHSYLYREADTVLCVACAGFGDLDFLPTGSAALTRRAAKYSTKTAVVVRFSRARKRYERQGILVETAALEKAEQECFEDADQRAAMRVQSAARRLEEDRQLAIRMAARIAILFPGCPAPELTAIARHTSTRGSGRVGRTGPGHHLQDDALTAAVVAAIRHRHTRYDELLEAGSDRATARRQIANKIEDVLRSWRVRPSSQTA